MQVLDEFFAELRFCAFDDLVNATEVIGGFDDIVHPHAFLGNADGVGFKNKARLLVGKAAALHVIGIIGQLNLYLMINSAVNQAALFFFENIRQGLRRGLAFIAPFGLLGIFGNVLGFCPSEKRRGHDLPRSSCGRCARRCSKAPLSLLRINISLFCPPKLLVSVYHIIGKKPIVQSLPSHIFLPITAVLIPTRHFPTRLWVQSGITGAFHALPKA